MSTRPTPVPYADDLEAPPPSEAEDIERIAHALETILARTEARSHKFRADVHAKTHGYARGEFQVLPDLPDELTQGLFAQPVTYPAIAHFSNSSSEPQADAIPDGRGLAIKVCGVAGSVLEVDSNTGPAQDFLMVNHPFFFARNVRDFLRIERVIERADGDALATLRGVVIGGDWNPLHWHWRETWNAVRIAGHFPAHPADNVYYSMTPIRFGNFMAKYRAKPIGDHQKSSWEMLKSLATNTDALRLALEDTLRAQPLSLEFQVQLCTSLRTMPIEDSSLAWPETESPFRTIALLHLPRQEIAELRGDRFYINLAFNVWHALVDHRPLGGLNRLRRRVYPISAAWRRRSVNTPAEVERK